MLSHDHKPSELSKQLDPLAYARPSSYQKNHRHIFISKYFSFISFFDLFLHLTNIFGSSADNICFECVIIAFYILKKYTRKKREEISIVMKLQLLKRASTA